MKKSEQSVAGAAGASPSDTLGVNPRSAFRVPHSSAARPGFPSALEHALLVGVDRSRPALERAVSRLSDLFTTGRRPGFEGYSRDADLLTAYNLFFFPQTYVRTAFVLAEIAGFRAWTPSGPTLRVLDLGAGAGAAGLSALDFFSRLGIDLPLSLHAIDQSPECLRRLESLFSAAHSLWPNATLRTWVGNLLQPRPSWGGPWDLIVAAFALNEALETAPSSDPVRCVDSLLSLLAPSGLLLIVEPATRAASQRLMAIRDVLVARGRAAVLAPCLHAAPCPMRNREDEWCHEVRRWKPPAVLEDLNRRLFRSIRTLKFSFLVLARDSGRPVDRAPGPVRLVSPVAELKGLARAFGCGADGTLCAAECLTRGLSRETEESMLNLERGDIVEWPDGRRLGDGATFRADGPPRVVFAFDG